MTITSRVIDAALNQKGGMKEPAIKAGYLITGDQKVGRRKLTPSPTTALDPRREPSRVSRLNQASHSGIKVWYRVVILDLWEGLIGKLSRD